jgi:hypothetical protein
LFRLALWLIPGLLRLEPLWLGAVWLLAHRLLLEPVRFWLAYRLLWLRLFETISTCRFRLPCRLIALVEAAIVAQVGLVALIEAVLADRLLLLPVRFVALIEAAVVAHIRLRRLVTLVETAIVTHIWLTRLVALVETIRVPVVEP